MLAGVYRTGRRLSGDRQRYRRMCTLCTSPIRAKKVTMLEPPYEMNGNGKPVIGINPMLMAMFWNICHRHHGEDPGTQVCAEHVARQPGNPPDTQQHDREQPDDHTAADQAELLADRREWEVGPLHRDVLGVGDLTVEPALCRRFPPVAMARNELRPWKMRSRSAGSLESWWKNTVIRLIW